MVNAPINNPFLFYFPNSLQTWVIFTTVLPAHCVCSVLQESTLNRARSITRTTKLWSDLISYFPEENPAFLLKSDVDRFHEIFLKSHHPTMKTPHGKKAFCSGSFLPRTSKPCNCRPSSRMQHDSAQSWRQTLQISFFFLIPFSTHVFNRNISMAFESCFQRCF